MTIIDYVLLSVAAVAFALFAWFGGHVIAGSVGAGAALACIRRCLVV